MRLVALLLSGAMFALPSVAAAAPPSHDEVYAIARKHFDEGTRLFDLAQARNDPTLYERAYAEFKVAYEAHATAHCVWDLIYAEVATRRFADAMSHLREWKRLDAAVTDPSKRSTPSERAKIGKTWADVFAATAHVTVIAPRDALVRVDQHEVPRRAPLIDPVDVAPGHHTISARIGDSELPAKPLDVTAGQEVTVDMTVNATTVAQPAAVAATAAVESHPSPPVSAERTIQITPEASHTDAPPSYLSTPRIAGIVLGGVGVAALVVSGVLAGRSNSDASSADATIAQNGPYGGPSTADVTSKREAQGEERTWSIAAGAVGLTAIAAGAALFLWPSSRESAHGTSSSLTLVPYGAANGAGFLIQGQL